MNSAIDHLVIVASSLEQGAAWCEATLGITPGEGGEHKLFGTHNRLFKIATPANPMAYCEIIAINPDAKRETASSAKRWFDMDDAALQAAVATEPRLAHFVVNTPPTLIQWGQPGDAEPMRLHPRNSPPRSRVTLQNITSTHPQTATLQAAYAAIGLQSIAVHAGPANLTATLQTPKGVVTLASHGL